MLHAAYIICQGDTPERAEVFARHAQRSCRITAVPAPEDSSEDRSSSASVPLVEQPLPHRLGDRRRAIADTELRIAAAHGS